MPPPGRLRAMSASSHPKPDGGLPPLTCFSPAPLLCSRSQYPAPFTHPTRGSSCFSPLSTYIESKTNPHTSHSLPRRPGPHPRHRPHGPHDGLPALNAFQEISLKHATSRHSSPQDPMKIYIFWSRNCSAIVSLYSLCHSLHARQTSFLMPPRAHQARAHPRAFARALPAAQNAFFPRHLCALFPHLFRLLPMSLPQRGPPWLLHLNHPPYSTPYAFLFLFMA